MSDNIKVCPLLMMALETRGGRLFDGSDLDRQIEEESCACLEDRCAWYSWGAQMCGILVAALGWKAPTSETKASRRSFFPPVQSRT